MILHRATLPPNNPTIRRSRIAITVGRLNFTKADIEACALPGSAHARDSDCASLATVAPPRGSRGTESSTTEIGLRSVAAAR